MDTLFPVEPVLPPGFVYQPDFISVQEEDELLQVIASSITYHTFHFQGYEAKRKVASFGYSIDPVKAVRYSITLRTLRT